MTDEQPLKHGGGMEVEAAKTIGSCLEQKAK